MKSNIIVLRGCRPTRDAEARVCLGENDVPFVPTLRVDNIQEDIRELDSIRQQGDVEAAAEVIPLTFHEPADRVAKSVETWGLTAIGMEETVRSGVGATIAILDTGIDRSHSAFRHLEKDQLVEEDFTGDGNGDADGHGTHCAGTAFGGFVGDLPIGVAPGVSKALIGKVLGRNGGSSASLAAAIDWALRGGANVISMSCGFDYPGMVEKLMRTGVPTKVAAARAMEAYWDTREFFAAIASRSHFEPKVVGPKGQLLRGQPVVFIAAAGNSSDWNANRTYVVGAEPPASANGFVAVGALGQRSPKRYFVASFSNRRVLVSAPGVNIVSAAAGDFNGLMTMSGTSMAVPHVAGIAALWYEDMLKRRKMVESGFELRDAIIRCACEDGIEEDRINDAGRGLVRAPLSRA